MPKNIATKPVKAVKAVKAVPAPVAAPKPPRAPKKAPAPLAAGLVMAKDAPTALVLAAPAPPVLKRPRKDAVEGPTESMGFRVPAQWAKEFRSYSFHRGTKLHQTLMDALEALKEKEAI